MNGGSGDVVDIGGDVADQEVGLG
jgi:hypothetical protein